MTAPAPDFRAVDQHTGDVAGVDAELDKMRAQRDEARAELDEAMCHLRLAHESNAGLSKWAGVYQSERDELAEERDDLLREIGPLREADVRVDELEAENERLRGELDTYRSAVTR